MKTAGGLLVIAATSMGGIAAAQRIGNQYEQLKYLQKIIYLLRSEILYARSYLGEAFCQIAKNVKSPYKEWLHEMCAQMERRGGTAFTGIWEEKTRRCLKDAGLPRGALERLISFGNQLGIADAQMQAKILDLYLEEIGQSIEELSGEMRTRTRLCHCLGVMSGIFITILLI